MQHMEKAKLYNVDGNRTATAKQCYAVGNHFGRLHATTPSEAFRLGKVFAAILLKFNAEHCETPITHGDVSKFFELEKVPAKFLDKIEVKVRATKTVKTKKTTAQPEVVKPSDQSVSEFAARLEAIDARFNKVEAAVESHDKKIASIDAKMDLIMAFLETNPDL